MIGWVTPRNAALFAGRPERTIRDWAARDVIPSIRHPETGALLVDPFAADDEAQKRRRHAIKWYAA